MRRFLLIALVMAPGWIGAQVRAAKAPPPAPAVDPLDELMRDSPFMPAGGPVAAAPEGGPLELRGVLFEGGQFLFSIHDQGTKESKWVRLGERDTPYVARSFDHENDVLTVDYQGRQVALKLPPARVTELAPSGAPQDGNPAPMPTPQPATRPGPSRQPQQPPPAGPSTPPTLKPEEAQRLQNMADEIRRRRQLPKK